MEDGPKVWQTDRLPPCDHREAKELSLSVWANEEPSPRPIVETGGTRVVADSPANGRGERAQSLLARATCLVAGTRLGNEEALRPRSDFPRRSSLWVMLPLIARSASTNSAQALQGTELSAAATIVSRSSHM